MAGSWNWPKLINKIKDDIPFLQQALNALLKRDPTSISDIPEGAKRLKEISAGKWQEQIYNGASWEPLGKLMHDVDTLDGYNAAITPQANTVAVRNKNGLLEDSITGNAASSDVAGTLSQTLPVNKGGTGATTSAAARTNLGVPPTSHASSNTTYGLGSNANYGHVRGDGVTTNVVSGEVVAKDIALGGDSADPATKRGYLAKDRVPWYGGNIDAIDDFNALTLPGCYQIKFSSTTQNAPDGVIYNSSGFNDGYIEVFKISSAATISSYARIGQRLTVYGGYGFTAERVQGVSGTAFHPWRRLIDDGDVATTSAAGIVKPGTGMTVDGAGTLKVSFNNTVTSTSTTQAATANAVKIAYDKGAAASNAAVTAQTTATSAKNAAAAAQDTADQALNATLSSGKVTKRGERSTSGDWTLTGLTVGKPVYLLFITSGKLPVGVIRFHAKTGSIESLYDGTGGAVFGLGNDNQSQVMGNVAVFIPTSTTLTIWISLSSGAQKAIIYQ